MQGHSGVTIHFDDGDCVEGSLLIAADGIHSPIRKQLYPQITYRYAGYTCWRGVADLSLSDTSLIKQPFIEAWGIKGRVGLIPLPNQQIYWYALINANANDPNYSSFTVDNLSNHFEHYHTPISSIIKETKPNRVIHRDVIDIKPTASVL